MTILEHIESPADLRKLPVDQLPALVVELTIALHYAFETPSDQLLWDVGHQGYPHKLLTGRNKRMETLRQEAGVSGFLKRSESEYDAFGAGHAATSISAALGMAAGGGRNGESVKVAA